MADVTSPGSDQDALDPTGSAPIASPLLRSSRRKPGASTTAVIIVVALVAGGAGTAALMLNMAPTAASSAVKGPVPASKPIVPVVAATVAHTEQKLEVDLEASGGVLRVPARLNDALTLGFVLDSGASDVSIPADVVLTLARTGTITKDDFVGEQTYTMADGSTKVSPTFRLKKVVVGPVVLRDVMASVGDTNGVPLLGQTFLSRISHWSIDNGRKKLLLVTNADTETPSTLPTSVADVADTATASPVEAVASTETAATGATLPPASRVNAYFSAWSGEQLGDGEALRGFYAGLVDYFGSSLGADEVIREKTKFAARWPNRQYHARPDSLRTFCRDDGACTVTGLVDWDVSSTDRERHSAGAAAFAYTLKDGMILRETSSVVARGPVANAGATVDQSSNADDMMHRLEQLHDATVAAASRQPY